MNDLSEMNIKVGASRMLCELIFSDSKGEKKKIHIGKLIAGVQRKEFSNDFLIPHVEEGPEKHPELLALSLPVLVHYQVDRKMVELPVDSESTRFALPQFKAYVGAWGASFKLGHFIRWFVEEENKENREKIRLKDFEYRSPGLDAVRSAWETFFAALGERQYTNLRVEEREINQFTSVPSSLVITKDGQDLNLSQLSDGEQLSLGMVADIAHRLVIANPKLTNPLEGKGIVLIDEIELHLHPAWQRRIVPALEKTFPGIQFILTTHSPQVVSEIARSQVFLLENFKVIKEVPHTLGRDSNTLLQDVFNVPERPEAAKEEFDKLYRILDNPRKKEEAKGLLREMSQKYGADDPEIQRATLHYEFMNEA